MEGIFCFFFCVFGLLGEFCDFEGIFEVMRYCFFGRFEVFGEFWMSVFIGKLEDLLLERIEYFHFICRLNGDWKFWRDLESFRFFEDLIFL